MIFLTVGTGPDGFDRLVRGVDDIAPDLDEPVCAQIGRGEYVPEHLDWFRFTSEAAIHDLYREADLVVAHAGAGTLLTALSYGTPVVVLPRLAGRGEHTDDHQLELARALGDRPDVRVVSDTDELAAAIEKSRPEGNGGAERDDSLVSFLSSYIDGLES